MSFLAPWFLLLGGAALVPLLIHLLRRRVGVQVEFPAARYLARAEQEHSRSLRMRNLLLMLLRVLAVLLIALAAARPAARVGGTGGGHAPTAIAIVLDNSMSTAVVENGAPLLDEFRAMARDVLASATPDDRVWIVTADGAVRGGSATALREEVDRVRALAGAGDPRDAVARGIALVEGSGLDARQVVVLTDGQRTAWGESDARARGAGTSILIYQPSRPAPVNRAVAMAEARPVRWTPRGAVAARVLSPDSTTYRMSLGERTLARGTVAPNAEAIIRAAPAERGWTAGTIEIEPDELPADNTRHFALWIGPAPAVRVEPGAGQFARSAVEVLRGSDRVTEGRGILVASADEATALPALVAAPSDGVRLGAANRALERLGIPWRFGRPRRETAVARGEQLQGVSVSMRYELVPRGVPRAETLAMVGSSPWIVAGPRYVLVASPLDPAATNFPVTAGFLPWLTDALSARLHAEPGGVRYAEPASRVARPVNADALESAAGGRIALEGATVEAPSAAGTYFFIQGNRRVGALVVNPGADESRLERWSAEDLAQRVAEGGARVVSERDAWTRLAFQGAARRSLIAPLLLLTLIMLGAEGIAATTRAGSRV